MHKLGPALPKRFVWRARLGSFSCACDKIASQLRKAAKQEKTQMHTGHFRPTVRIPAQNLSKTDTPLTRGACFGET